MMSAIISVRYATMANKELYGNELVDIFPAMRHVSNDTEDLEYIIGVTLLEFIFHSLIANNPFKNFTRATIAHPKNKACIN